MTSNHLTAGLSFKPEYFEAAHTCGATGMWYEIHAENYMVAGGPRLTMLDAICRDHPVSVHGVGLSLAADVDPDPTHLKRLAEVVKRTQAVLVSEHLAWSDFQGAHFPDLLPVPRNRETLQRIARNIDITQNVLQRPLLIENPSLYMSLDHEMSEPEFLSELTKRTGCGLLVDVNNAYISAHNVGGDAASYLAQLPAQAIGEIHLAGHALDAASIDTAHQHSVNARLLIDTHGASVAEPVWQLYQQLLARIGARPTLIERDDNLPSFDELLSERQRATDYINAVDIASRTHDRLQERRYAKVS